MGPKIFFPYKIFSIQKNFLGPPYREEIYFPESSGRLWGGGGGTHFFWDFWRDCGGGGCFDIFERLWGGVVLKIFFWRRRRQGAAGARGSAAGAPDFSAALRAAVKRKRKKEREKKGRKKDCEKKFFWKKKFLKKIFMRKKFSAAEGRRKKIGFLKGKNRGKIFGRLWGGGLFRDFASTVGGVVSSSFSWEYISFLLRRRLAFGEPRERPRRSKGGACGAAKKTTTHSRKKFS